MSLPTISIGALSTLPISTVHFTGIGAFGASISIHATPTDTIITMDAHTHGIAIVVDTPEDLVATMPDVTSIMYQLQDMDPDMEDIDLDMEDIIPDTDQVMAVDTILITVDTADMEVVMAVMAVTVPAEDKPYNTYFIDNPLIIGG